MNDYDLLKRIFDILSVIIFAFFISPLFILIFFLILIFDKRPVFYIQQRLGKDGKIFTLIKFRTMIVNAIKKGDGIFVKDNDNRITHIGHFLRKYSLDELPQLINVIKGDMSVIGPRPPLPFFPYKYEDYPLHIKKRFACKPGLTGWAQINGRKNIEWEKRFIYDLEYIKKRSFIFDIIILLRSIVLVIKKEGIYGKD